MILTATAWLNDGRTATGWRDVPRQETENPEWFGVHLDRIALGAIATLVGDDPREAMNAGSGEHLFVGYPVARSDVSTSYPLNDPTDREDD